MKEDILSSTFFRYENLSTFLSAQWKYYPLHSLIVRKINVLQFNRNCVRSTSSKGLLDILMSTLVLFCIATVISFIAIGWGTWGKNRSHNNALQFPTRLSSLSLNLPRKKLDSRIFFKQDFHPVIFYYLLTLFMKKILCLEGISSQKFKKN